MVFTVNPEHHEQMLFLSTRRELLRTGFAGALALGAGGLLLGGCSSQRVAAGDVPEPRWPEAGGPPSTGRRWEPLPPNEAPSGNIGVIPRSDWARGAPVPRLMDRADRPYSKITLHHDGMPDPFYSTDRGAASARVERIRAAHRNRGFGDIGYHYLVDPAGRVWAGRDLSWQGAHVANQNPGNLGICVMGNYQIQQPNQAQLEAVERFVAAQMSQHRIRLADVKTHQERAPTECPGRSLQPRLTSMRSSSMMLARA